jgi:DNA-binding NtrC family response regulator
MAATILIADDDAVARRLVENMVQKCGYETTVVESGDAAIALLTAPDAPVIDAVVLDLVMPGLDGMGVLAKIREAGLNIPVIVQTAHGGIDNVVSAMRAGAQDFVVKPQCQRAERRVAAYPAQPRRQIDLRRYHHPQ